MRNFIVLALSFLAPVAAFAQNISVGPAYTGNQNVFTLLATGQSLMNLIIRVLVGFAILVVVWGSIKFMMADGDKAKEGAKNTIIYGVLGLFVITTIWGLVGILRRTVGTGTPGSSDVVLPCVPGQNQNC